METYDFIDGKISPDYLHVVSHVTRHLAPAAIEATPPTGLSAEQGADWTAHVATISMFD